MRMRLRSLSIVFRGSREVINLESNLVAFHGETGSGKSSVLRIIDYCLGGDVPSGQVVRDEFLSASLELTLDTTLVLLERSPAHTPSSVRVTWQSSDESEGSMEFPLIAGERAVFSDDVFAFSDMVFHLLGVKPLYMTLRRASGPQSVRLSIRDLLWYCYLRQTEIDSNFYNLKTQGKDIKSRKAFEFIVGYYTELLSDLEHRRAEVEGQMRANRDSAEKLSALLRELGYGDKQEIEAELSVLEQRLEDATTRYASVRSDMREQTHPLDALRAESLKLTRAIDHEADALVDLERLSNDNSALRADLITMKFKLARKTVAQEILAGVAYSVCPACGRTLPHRAAQGVCALCGQDETASTEADSAEALSADLDERIGELDESIARMSDQLSRQRIRIRGLEESRAEVDQRLSEELEFYASRGVAEMKQAEYERAKLVERVRHLRESLRLPETVVQILGKNADLELEKQSLTGRMDIESAKLESSDTFIQEIEVAYKHALLAVRFPDFHESDEIHLNRRSWIPEIWPAGDNGRAWSYFEEASSGKRALLNVCYALAVHAVGELRALQLPSLLMIDSPARHIDKDVDETMFNAFYEHLYKTIEEGFSETQVIIVENSLVAPPAGIELIQRRMTREDPSCPPLIPYRLQE